ncbi:unnamed protein product [Brassica oleracea]
MGCPHLRRRLFAYGDGCDGHFDGFPVSGAVSASRCTLLELYEAHRLPPQPTARYGSQTRVLVHLRARSTTVLCMLGNEYLAVEKRLPLALIALVDGVICPSNKDLKLTPRYVEMLSDVESFLAYPWGRESFLTTVPRFLPPLVVGPGANPLQVMRDRLSQKTTVCYGFPLALQLFVFDVVPLLLEKILDAGNTATFIDSPGACSSPSTILTVNEIVAVEEDPDLSVHFTVIPDEERLLLVDQNEDRQVTSLRFEGMENNIEELRTLICKSLGLPEGSKRNARKRKAMDDPQVRCTPSPDDSIVSETEGRNRKGNKRKTVGTRHVGKKTLPRRRSGGGKEEVSRKNPPSSERESGHQNDDDHAKENESDNARFPPSGGNKGDQQQETQSNALVLYVDVLDVEPESYVLSAEHAVTSPGAWQKRNPTYRYEQGSPVAWEKTKPNCYSSVGSVRSFHPSWDGNPSSKSKERSAPEGGEGHQKWVGAPPVGYESGQTSNQNDGEGLEQVSAPMGFVEALVKEINFEIPGADEEIRATRDGEGGQPKENKSVAARMTPMAGIDFAQKTGADNGGESGQTSNQNDGERLEQVSAPMGFVEALVKEINSEISGADEEIRATRGGEGAQPKENKSVAARMTPTAGIGFA